MSTPKTIAFFGASTGCGLSALKHSLSADHICRVLLRTPSKLDAHFLTLPSNLTVIAGNAHDISSVKETLTASQSSLVGVVVFSIGSLLNFKKMNLDDPNVCENGIKTLLAALKELREAGIGGNPRIIMVSSVGISTAGRDYPLLLKPLMATILKGAHADKRQAESLIRESGEVWTIVRPTMLTDGATEKKVRVGVEDPVKGLEKRELGYLISREDVGKWIFNKIVEGQEYEKKMVSLTWEKYISLWEWDF